jgi:hypothetical protein
VPCAGGSGHGPDLTGGGPRLLDHPPYDLRRRIRRTPAPRDTHTEHVLTIWRAEESSWDAQCSIDVQLRCGAGLDATTAYLTAEGSQPASQALQYLADCQSAGDVDGFSADEQTRAWAEYYLNEPATGT